MTGMGLSIETHGGGVIAGMAIVAICATGWMKDLEPCDI